MIGFLPLNQHKLYESCEIGKHSFPKDSYPMFIFYDVPILALKSEVTSEFYATVIVDESEIIRHGTNLYSKSIYVNEIINKDELFKKSGDNIFDVITGIYYFKNNLLHKEDNEPAVIKSNGDQYYCQNGLIHRDNSWILLSDINLNCLES